MRIHVPRRFLGKTHTSRLYKYKRYMSTHPKVAKNSPRSDAFTILFEKKQKKQKSKKAKSDEFGTPRARDKKKEKKNVKKP